MKSEVLRDRFLGTVCGIGVGDALGSQFEAIAGTQIDSELGGDALQMTGSRKYRLRPGDWCDDAGLAFAVMESFDRCRGFEGVDVAGSLLSYAKRNPKGIKPYVKDVLRGLESDFGEWENVSRDVWMSTGGAAAGSACLVPTTVAALFYYTDLPLMVEKTIRLCQISHFDPRCVEACLAVNLAILKYLNNHDEENMAHQAAAMIQTLRKTPRYKAMVMNFDQERLQEMTSFSPYLPYLRDRNAVIESLVELPNIRRKSELSTSRSVTDTMQVALWCTVKARSFREAIDMAVRLGNNSDVQGALTGAVAGARFGFAGIPREWSVKIRDSAKILAEAENLMARARQEDERDLESGKREPVRKPPPVM